MLRWITAGLVVPAAGLAGAFAGASLSWALGYWRLPGSGFVCALAAVCAAYRAAPTRKIAFATLCFVLGTALAWPSLLDQAYPQDHYPELAYQPTLLPFAATFLGGLLGLLAAGSVATWKRARGVQQAA